MIGSAGAILISLASAVIGVICLGAGIIGYMRVKAVTLERVLLVLGGLVLIKPGLPSDSVGLAILARIFWPKPFGESGKKGT